MPHVLAQTASLPRPAFLPRVVLEDPLLLTVGLIGAGIAAFFLYSSRGETRRGLMLGGAGLALAAAVQVLAFAVETPREKIIAATGPLVQATAAADTLRLDPMLDSGVQLSNEKGMAAGELPLGVTWGKAEILAQVREQLGSKWRIKQCEVLGVEGVIDGPGRGRTQVRVRTIPDVWDVPITTVWRIDWREDSRGRWLVLGIEPVDLGLPGRLR